MKALLTSTAVLFMGLIPALAAADEEPQPSADIIRLAHTAYAGSAAEQRHFNRNVVRDMRHLADLGSASAQYNLGVVYFSEHQYGRALDWYRRAASRGHATAEYNLGVMYYGGVGTDQDYRKAADWFRRSAQRGDPDAQFQLATMYFTGHGVPRDAELEARWYAAAAHQHHPLAQYNLAVLYHLGEGVPQDDVQSTAWMKLAEHEGLDTSAAQAIVTSDLDAEQMHRADVLYKELVNHHTD